MKLLQYMEIISFHICKQYKAGTKKLNPRNKLKKCANNEENFKIFLKDTVDLNEWKEVPCSRLGGFNIKRSVLSKLVHEFNVIPVTMPIGYFPPELDNLITNSHGKINTSNQES